VLPFASGSLLGSVEIPRGDQLQLKSQNVHIIITAYHILDTDHRLLKRQDTRTRTVFQLHAVHALLERSV
jgi:hypothetical protein